MTKTAKKKRVRKVLPAAVPNGAGTVGRMKGGKFAPGNAAAKGHGGNRKRAAVNRQVAEALSEKERLIIVRRAVRDAKAGDAIARAWLFDRIGGKPVPAPVDEGLALKLPPLKTAKDCLDATTSIIEAAGRGQLTMAETRDALELVAEARETVAKADLEQRIEQLERLGTL